MRTAIHDNCEALYNRRRWCSGQSSAELEELPPATEVAQLKCPSNRDQVKMHTRSLSILLLSIIAACSASEDEFHSRVLLTMESIGMGVLNFCEDQGTFEEAVEQFEEACALLSPTNSRIEIARVPELGVFVVFWRGSDGKPGGKDDVCMVYPLP